MPYEMVHCVIECSCVSCIQILPVCTSWYDYVWAYFKVMVDVLTEQVGYLTLVPQKRCLVECVEEGRFEGGGVGVGRGGG